MNKEQMIKQLVEKIKNGEKLDPFISPDYLDAIMKEIDDFDLIKNSGIANKFELDDNELHERFKKIKFEHKLPGRYKHLEFEQISKPPHANFLKNLLNNITESDAILELIDNSLDAITLSKSDNTLYTIDLRFIKDPTKPDGEEFSIFVVDNGCGLGEKSFNAMASLGLSGASVGNPLIGTWGSGFIVSCFRLGKKIEIGTVEEFIESGSIPSRPVRRYLIDSKLYARDTTDTNKMWIVQIDNSDKKEYIDTRSGNTWIEISKANNTFFTGSEYIYETLRKKIIFTLSKKLNSLHSDGKNIKIIIDAPGIDEPLIIENYNEEHNYNYKKYFSYHPIFPPITIKNLKIPIEENIEDFVTFEEEEEKIIPKILIRELTIAIATHKSNPIKDKELRSQIADGKIKVDAKGEFIEANGLWMWGNGRLFNTGTLYTDRKTWPFSLYLTHKSKQFANFICMHIEFEALNPSGNRLIPWKFPGKQEIHFTHNFDKAVDIAINNFFSAYIPSILTCRMPTINVKLFPSALLKDLTNDEIEKIIRDAFEYAEKNIQKRDNRDWVESLEDNIEGFVEIIKKLKENGVIEERIWDYDALIEEGSEEQKQWNDFNKKTKRYKNRLDEDWGWTNEMNDYQYTPISIIIQNIKEQFPDIFKLEEETGELGDISEEIEVIGENGEEDIEEIEVVSENDIVESEESLKSDTSSLEALIKENEVGLIDIPKESQKTHTEPITIVEKKSHVKKKATVKKKPVAKKKAVSKYTAKDQVKVKDVLKSITIKIFRSKVEKIKNHLEEKSEKVAIERVIREWLDSIEEEEESM